MKNWISLNESLPAEGQAVLVLHENKLNSYDWDAEVAYFCDGDFYNLKYDPNLGVLRKCYAGKDIEFWANYVIPSKE